MATPQLHRNGVYYARLAVPSDLWEIVGRRENTKSLNTRDPRTAAALFKVRVAEVEEEWAALRAAATALAAMPPSGLPVRTFTQKEAHALAGELYRRTLVAHGDNPGQAGTWLERLRDLQGCLPAHLRMSDVYIPFAGQPFMRPAVRATAAFSQAVNELVAEQGYSPSATSLPSLAQAAAIATAQAYGVLMRNAEGDYSPDPSSSRFPEVELAKDEGPGIGVEELVERWLEQPGWAAKTQKAYPGKLRMLMRFAGKDDVSQLVKFDVESWRDHRIKSGISSGTVSAGDLAGVRTILEWASKSTFVPEIKVNVAADVRILFKTQTIKTGDKSYSLDEAETVLAATLLPAENLRAQGAAARRWVPWLCAYSGARVGEIGQLSAGNVLQMPGREGMIWCIRLTPEDGSVKTKEARIVPIHPHIIEQGFLDYVASRGALPLFYDPSLARGGKKGHPQSDKVGQSICRWVRSLGIVRKIQPNHAWRHRFETICRSNEWRQDIVDAITGHAPKSTSAGYGDYSLQVRYDLICRLPRYLESAAAAR